MKKKAVVYIWPRLNKVGQNLMEGEIRRCGYTKKKAVVINKHIVWKCT